MSAIQASSSVGDAVAAEASPNQGGNLSHSVYPGDDHEEPHFPQEQSCAASGGEPQMGDGNLWSRPLPSDVDTGPQCWGDSSWADDPPEPNEERKKQIQENHSREPHQSKPLPSKEKKLFNEFQRVTNKKKKKTPENIVEKIHEIPPKDRNHIVTFKTVIINKIVNMTPPETIKAMKSVLVRQNLQLFISCELLERGGFLLRFRSVSAADAARKILLETFKNQYEKRERQQKISYIDRKKSFELVIRGVPRNIPSDLIQKEAKCDRIFRRSQQDPVCILSFNSLDSARKIHSSGIMVGKYYFEAEEYVSRALVGCRACGAVDCKGCEEIKCFKCGGLDHVKEQCQNDCIEVCFRCNSLEHPPDQCPVYKEKVQIATQRKKKTFLEALRNGKSNPPGLSPRDSVREVAQVESPSPPPSSDNISIEEAIAKIVPICMKIILETIVNISGSNLRIEPEKLENISMKVMESLKDPKPKVAVLADLVEGKNINNKVPNHEIIKGTDMNNDKITPIEVSDDQMQIDLEYGKKRSASEIEVDYYQINRNNQGDLNEEKYTGTQEPEDHELVSMGNQHYDYVSSILKDVDELPNPPDEAESEFGPRSDIDEEERPAKRAAAPVIQGRPPKITKPSEVRAICHSNDSKLCYKIYNFNGGWVNHLKRGVGVTHTLRCRCGAPLTGTDDKAIGAFETHILTCNITPPFDDDTHELISDNKILRLRNPSKQSTNKTTQ